MTAVDDYARHVDPAFIKLLGVLGYGRVFTRASGVHVWDDQGRRYLDLLAGFGSVNIGHNHPRLLARLREFLDEQPLNLSHTGPSAYAAELASELARITGLEAALFANGGAEAVEAAIKLARAATKRTRIVYCEGAYHGLSLGTLSVSASKRMRSPFEPLLPGCTAIPFDDLDALERELKKGDVAAFLMEPIQIEGGVRFPKSSLAEMRTLCAKHGALFALDEVQTGFGRTGTMFAFEQDDARPDILVLAKSAGGSIAPIGVTMTTRRLQKKAYGSMRRFDLYGSTFAGNAFACVAALETLRIIEEEELVRRSAELGSAMLRDLRARLSGHSLVADVRGKGLLIAIVIPSGSEGPGRAGRDDRHSSAARPSRSLATLGMTNLAGQWLSLALLEHGLIVQPASQAWDVLRIEPPLTITPADVDEACMKIGEVFDENRSLAPILANLSKRAIVQIARRGRFR